MKSYQETDPYKEEIITNTKLFAEISSKIIQSFYQVDCQISEPEYSKSNIHIGKNISISILFTGVIYGEYVLALNDETVRALMKGLVGKNIQDDQEVAEQLCELLNMVVGESIEGLISSYKKLTITVPKIHFGTTRYPRVKSGKSVLKTVAGEIECYLYVDHMQLDIATSYKQALDSFMNTNQELKNVLKKLEEQQAMIIQSEKLAALGMMAGGVAHEINNPLTIIQLRTNQLKKGLEKADIDRESFIKALNGIDSTILRISKIVCGLRTFARDGSKDPLSPVKVSSIIDDTLVLCQEKYKNHGVDLKISIKSDDEVNCRPSEISQVLINLLNNSYDAIQDSNDKWVEIVSETTSDKIIITVTDSGLGIPVEIQNKLMQPFYTTKEIGKGTGLGLSISRGIIEDHCGMFYYNSKSAHTQFVIELPRVVTQLKSDLNKIAG